MPDSFMVTNKYAWDLRTGVHVDSQFYNVEQFLQGGITLNKPELDLVGSVVDKRLLHLQCHFGLDSLSWDRLGATVTGVDISAVAIDKARQLNRQCKMKANFIEGDVHGLSELVDSNAFDFVFSSYGVTCWLSNLDVWARGIYHSLKPSGKFVLVEFHPILDLLFNGKVSGIVNHFSDNNPVGAQTSGTYTDPQAPIKYYEYRWKHTISEIITALVNNGFNLNCFNEYPYCPYRLFSTLDTCENGLWFSSSDRNKIPYLYSLVVEKKSVA